MVPIKLEWFAPVQNALSEVVFGFVFHFCDRSPGAGWLSRTLGVLTLSVLLSVSVLYSLPFPLSDALLLGTLQHPNILALR